MKYSQFNEEEIIEEIFNKIGTTNKYFVEIGCLENGRFSNTYLLKEKGWIGHWFDCNESPAVIREMFTKDNINEILNRYNVPIDLDFMSIDVDGDDYWLFKTMIFRPRVLCIEYNSNMEDGIAEEGKIWTGGKVFGSSEKEFLALARQKGYNLYTKNSSNLFFICQNQ